LVERALKFSSIERSIFVKPLTGDVPLILQLHVVPHQESIGLAPWHLLPAIRSIEERWVVFHNKISSIIEISHFGDVAILQQALIKQTVVHPSELSSVAC
jgi:hypothetical protein